MVLPLFACCLMVQGGYSGSSCRGRKNKKPAAPLLRFPARNPHTLLPVTFYFLELSPVATCSCKGSRKEHFPKGRVSFISGTHMPNQSGSVMKR